MLVWSMQVPLGTFITLLPFLAYFAGTSLKLCWETAKIQVISNCKIINKKEEHPKKRRMLRETLKLLNIKEPKNTDRNTLWISNISIEYEKDISIYIYQLSKNWRLKLLYERKLYFEHSQKDKENRWLRKTLKLLNFKEPKTTDRNTL